MPNIDTPTHAAIIDLFIVDITNHNGPIYRFTNQTVDYTYQSILYNRAPIQIGNVKYAMSEAPAQPTLTISNIVAEIQANVLLYKNLLGSEITHMRVLDEVTPVLISKDIFIIEQKVAHNKEIISFKLRSSMDLPNMKLPRRKLLKDGFPGVGRTRISQ